MDDDRHDELKEIVLVISQGANYNFQVINFVKM